jgi:hypothetical protein
VGDHDCVDAEWIESRCVEEAERGTGSLNIQLFVRISLSVSEIRQVEHVVHISRSPKFEDRFQSAARTGCIIREHFNEPNESV